jgi:HlyD family secretion protein
MRSKVLSKVRMRSVILLVCFLGLVSVAHVVAIARGGWSELIHGTDAGQTEMDRGGMEPQRVVAEGRVVAYPGGELILSAEATGRIVRLAAQEKQNVSVGDVIAELDSSELMATQAESQSRVAELDAELHLAQAKLAQVERLSPRAISAVDILELKRDVETCTARQKEAVAALARVEAQLAKTRIVAPIDGAVIHRWTDPGQMVQLGAPVVSIADLKRTRIEAEVNEFDAGRIEPGDSVIITAEGYPGTRWQGTVEEIPDVVTGRRLMPQDPGRPADTGVLMVKVSFQEPTPLKLGQRVEVTIEAGVTKKHAIGYAGN